MKLGNNAKKLSDVLNASISKLNIKNLDGKLRFFGGNFIEQLKLALSDLPYSNVAVVYSKDTFCNRHEEVDRFLKTNGNTFKDIVLEDGCENFVANGEFLSLPENIRAIICMDEVVFDASAYFANYYGIRLIENVTSSKLNVYNSVLYKKNDQVELCSLFIQRHFILDADNFVYDVKDDARLFASLMENIVSLIDYSVFCEYTKQTFTGNVFERFSSVLNEGFNIFSVKYDKRFIKLLQLNFELLIINHLENGNLLDCSAVRNLALLSNNKDEYDKRLSLAKKIMGIYKIACDNISVGNLFASDCNDRAYKIQEFINIPQEKMLNCYIYQNGMMADNSDKEKGIFEKIADKINFLYQSFSKILLIYNALGGDRAKLEQSDYSAIKYAGDIFNCFNGLTLLRNQGILELI